MEKSEIRLDCGPPLPPLNSSENMGFLRGNYRGDNRGGKYGKCQISELVRSIWFFQHNSMFGGCDYELYQVMTG